MKNRTFEVGIVILLIVVSLILFGIYLIVDLINANNTYTMFLKPYTILQCTKWDCKNVSDKLLEYNNKSYNIFFDGRKIGMFDLYYESREGKYYVFDTASNNMYDGERLFAYSGKATLVQKDYQINTDIDDEEINDLDELIDNDLSDSYISKIELDFDNDGKLESLYQINKDSNLDDDSEERYSILIYKDNKYKIITSSGTGWDKASGFSYVSNILDIFDDGKLEFIHTTSFYDNLGACNVIYRLKGKEFVAINECELVESREGLLD